MWYICELTIFLYFSGKTNIFIISNDNCQDHRVLSRIRIKSQAPEKRQPKHQWQYHIYGSKICMVWKSLIFGHLAKKKNDWVTKIEFWPIVTALPCKNTVLSAKKETNPVFFLLFVFKAYVASGNFLQFKKPRLAEWGNLPSQNLIHTSIYEWDFHRFMKVKLT